ncbi:MAG: GNAT family N-acetyltransferase [Nocardioides sp.]
MIRFNEFGQPMGAPVPTWTGARPAESIVLSGRFVRVEPLADQHAGGLFAALGGLGNAARWTYTSLAQPADPAGMRDQIARQVGDPATVSFAIVPLGLPPAGRASYLRIDPANGSIEVGAIQYGDALVRTAAATEAMYLLARHAFEGLGYRRYEWKCDSLNQASRAAARRLGFSYEGRFRQAAVYRGRNRDTDWFSITDAEWPRLRAAYDVWLDPVNFDEAGRQRRRLSRLIEATRTDPRPGDRDI